MWRNAVIRDKVESKPPLPRETIMKPGHVENSHRIGNCLYHEGMLSSTEKLQAREGKKGESIKPREAAAERAPVFSRGGGKNDCGAGKISQRNRSEEELFLDHPTNH